ncbi:hypothetical protein OYE22_22900 [Streptomyces sp. 71268]|uniref:hypothetical protein n=1 Tax=Streptomyces sp. 71268 TaxID=3002640 RepID=UPI0023F98BF3|nr:hypothetical protein [Streptomyces sp. 71268]WEV27710.1 hypothetical protein OYE22_22900 [Streptomyces sp. 71268]
MGSIGLSFGVLGTAPSQAASAVTCTGWEYANYDDATGSVSKAGHMKVGPYAACDDVEYLAVATNVYYWCYAVNDYGNTWTYARIKGTSTQGWISDGSLTNGGSHYPCRGQRAPQLPESLQSAQAPAAAQVRTAK